MGWELAEPGMKRRGGGFCFKLVFCMIASPVVTALAAPAETQKASRNLASCCMAEGNAFSPLPGLRARLKSSSSSG